MSDIEDIDNVVVLAKRRAASRKRATEKWGEPVMKLGFCILPSLIFRAQQRLGLEFTGEELISYDTPRFGRFHRDLHDLLQAGALYHQARRHRHLPRWDHVDAEAHHQRVLVAEGHAVVGAVVLLFQGMMLFWK